MGAAQEIGRVIRGNHLARSHVVDPAPELIAYLDRTLDDWKRRNDALITGAGPAATVPLRPDTEAALRALGYID